MLRDKLDIGLIKGHVNKFHPIKHHYRYEHAPNRFYLPQDLTIVQMHHDYLLQQDVPKCSFETYRKVVRSMGISFTRLAGEECSRCSLQVQHTREAHGRSEEEPRYHEQGCEACDAHQKHLDAAKEAREAYREDAEKNHDPCTTYMSADMMKVCMIPQLPIKEALFTPRLTCYNETFALLKPRRGSKDGNQCRNCATCIIWHEGLAGRSGGEVAAAFYLFLTTVCRDVPHVVLWLDNCAGQNKSWTLVTTLLKAVNSPSSGTNSITLKFFEPGHTSMSADAVHQVVSKNLKRRDAVEDFKDYEDATGDAGVRSIVMEPGQNMV